MTGSTSVMLSPTSGVVPSRSADHDDGLHPAFYLIPAGFVLVVVTLPPIIIWLRQWKRRNATVRSAIYRPSQKTLDLPNSSSVLALQDIAPAEMYDLVYQDNTGRVYKELTVTSL